MGNSMRMRRVPADELQRGVPLLEEAFSATRNNEVFASEIRSGILCSLGEEWRTVNLLLTGEEFPAAGPAALPVLGGVHVGSFATPVDMMVWLDADGVHIAHEYLASIEFDAMFDLHRKKLGAVGDAAAEIEDDLRRRLQNLQHFYGLADAGHQAVVKRVYSG
ncbi:DUF1877 family protein [Streptomyces sp. R44]|uniref:DUF1877 family protein n=1 Tax=Streptomyces sp. R44 TaxID=3238633 RepID=A0AB39T441_9ACTN